MIFCILKSYFIHDYISDRNRGKRSIFLDFKKSEDLKIFKKLASKSDIIIDPYRPGVLEKLGLDPVDLLKSLNERLIICRMTGYGQNSPYNHKAGHDINYLSDSGVLSTFGPKGHPPVFPNNLLVKKIIKKIYYYLLQ